MTYKVFGGMLSLTQSINQSLTLLTVQVPVFSAAGVLQWKSEHSYRAVRFW